MNMLDFITKLLAATLAMGTSLAYATLGEVYTQKTGILNLGMEGIMLMGALAGFTTAFNTGNLYLALMMAMMVGGDSSVSFMLFFALRCGLTKFLQVLPSLCSAPVLPTSLENGLVLLPTDTTSPE